MEPIDTKGNLAKQIRQKRGKIKLKDFARMVDVHKDQLNRYEKGRSRPRADIYKKIMEYEPEPLLGADKIFDPEAAYEVSTTEEKKLVDKVLKIARTKKTKTVEALKATIEAFFETAVMSEGDDEDK